MAGKASRGCFRHSLLALLLLMLSACNIELNALPGAIAVAPSEAVPGSGWTVIAPGLAWREIAQDQDQLSQLKILRVDPQHYSFRAKYSPAKPYSLAQWRAREPEAAAIVNANFFDPSYLVLGLVISDGQAHGRPYRERGGSFLVKEGQPAVRANHGLSQRDLASAEQAVQGFPLLVDTGEQTYFGQARQERARRTAIAEDAAGRILIISAPLLGPTLRDLSAFLAQSDLEIETAFNLDGGGSTLMAVPDIDYYQPSFDAVPAILAVYKR
ncbi:MAG: phosphodiester glycosidase family protein [Chloroflexi bacterium]|nr:phosphodiester glycosidase family protein [Chloroflexota bacterium]